MSDTAAVGLAPEVLDRLRMWKRNGEIGVYVVEIVGDARGERVKIRLCYHTWTRIYIDGKYATRWVLSRRLRALDAHERDRLLRSGWPA